MSKPQTASRTTLKGFTLVEVAVTMVIISLAVLAMMAAQQAYHRQNAGAAQMSTAMMLANEIRELTLEMPLRDPIYGNWKFGPEPDEANGDPHVAVQNFDDLDDFAGEPDGAGSYPGVTFDGPITALRQTIPNMTGWSQHVTAESVAEDNIAGPAVAPHSSEMVRLTVRVLYRRVDTDEDREITRLTWLSAGRP